MSKKKDEQLKYDLQYFADGDAEDSSGGEELARLNIMAKGGADDGTPPEPEPKEPVGHRLTTVVNGVEETRVYSTDELAEAVQKASDYTKKTQELAAERNAANLSKGEYDKLVREASANLLARHKKDEAANVDDGTAPKIPQINKEELMVEMKTMVAKAARDEARSAISSERITAEFENFLEKTPGLTKEMRSDIIKLTASTGWKFDRSYEVLKSAGSQGMTIDEQINELNLIRATESGDTHRNKTGMSESVREERTGSIVGGILNAKNQVEEIF